MTASSISLSSISRHYGSLSAIALVATGTRWNGLLFFGLTERRRG